MAAAESRRSCQGNRPACMPRTECKMQMLFPNVVCQDSSLTFTWFRTVGVSRGADHLRLAFALSDSEVLMHRFSAAAWNTLVRCCAGLAASDRSFMKHYILQDLMQRLTGSL